MNLTPKKLEEYRKFLTAEDWPEDVYVLDMVEALIGALDEARARAARMAHCGEQEPVSGCDCNRCLVRSMQRDYLARLEATARAEKAEARVAELESASHDEWVSRRVKIKEEAEALKARVAELEKVLRVVYEAHCGNHGLLSTEQLNRIAADLSGSEGKEPGK